MTGGSRGPCFTYISALFLKYLAKISFNQKMASLGWSPWSSKCLIIFRMFGRKKKNCLGGC